MGSRECEGDQVEFDQGYNFCQMTDLNILLIVYDAGKLCMLLVKEKDSMACLEFVSRVV